MPAPVDPRREPKGHKGDPAYFKRVVLSMLRAADGSGLTRINILMRARNRGCRLPRGFALKALSEMQADGLVVFRDSMWHFIEKQEAHDASAR